MADAPVVERKQGHCALCIARCGSVAVIRDGCFVALEPDPSHPTGQALCAKGRAAPELVYHPDRLLPREVRETAWKAQVRLCARHRRLQATGKRPQVVVTAIAREMLGFAWAIAALAGPKPAAG
jgi:predicted molibdopterin-dependent oxidoreductase YjgC